MPARNLLGLRTSAIHDIYELDEDARQNFVGRFLRSLIAARRELWGKALMVLDEPMSSAQRTVRTKASSGLSADDEGPGAGVRLAEALDGIRIAPDLIC